MNRAKDILICLLIVNCSWHFIKTTAIDNITINATSMKANLIDVNWDAYYIEGATQPFDEHCSGRKPNINFNSEKGMVTGFAGCNSLFGKINLKRNRISWSEDISMTKKIVP